MSKVRHKRALNTPILGESTPLSSVFYSGGLSLVGQHIPPQERESRAKKDERNPLT